MTKRTKHMRKRSKAHNRKDVPRTPSGAPSRSADRYTVEEEKQERNAKVIVMTARQRVLGCSEAEADIPETGSSLGRLYRAGLISARLFNAGNHFAEDVWRYHRLTGIPHQSPRALDYSRVQGRSMERSPEEVKAASNRRMELYSAIQCNDRAGRPVETVISRCCLMDEPAENWPPHMIKILALGLRVLADFYGMAKDQPLGSVSV